jgi:hypothetical protein
MNDSFPLLIHVGPVPKGAAVRRVELTPTGECTPESVAALIAAHITPADLRARVVFAATGSLHDAAAVYAALIGFAARRLDLLGPNGERINAEHLRLPVETVWLDEIPDSVVVGAVDGAVNPLDTTGASQIATARTVVVHPATTDVVPVTMIHFLAVASLRRRKDHERLPQLATADGAVDLDAFRRAGADLRRSMTAVVGRPLAPAEAASPRRVALQSAAAAPVTTVLTELGASFNDEAQRWHCPRPARHRNGDATPSARVTESNRFQCFKCDPEPVSPLRLVVDVQRCTPDEAASWIAQHTR